MSGCCLSDADTERPKTFRLARRQVSRGRTSREIETTAKPVGDSGRLSSGRGVQFPSVSTRSISVTPSRRMVAGRGVFVHVNNASPAKPAVCQRLSHHACTHPGQASPRREGLGEAPRLSRTRSSSAGVGDALRVAGRVSDEQHLGDLLDRHLGHLG